MSVDPTLLDIVRGHIRGTHTFPGRVVGRRQQQEDDTLDCREPEQKELNIISDPVHRPRDGSS